MSDGPRSSGWAHATKSGKPDSIPYRVGACDRSSLALGVKKGWHAVQHSLQNEQRGMGAADHSWHSKAGVPKLQQPVGQIRPKKIFCQ